MAELPRKQLIKTVMAGCARVVTRTEVRQSFTSPTPEIAAARIERSTKPDVNGGEQAIKDSPDMLDCEHYLKPISHRRRLRSRREGCNWRNRSGVEGLP